MSHNPITGDRLASKIGDKEKFDKGYDLIFCKDQPPERPAQEWPLPTEPEKCD